MNHIPKRNRAMVELVYATGFARLCTSPGGWEPWLRTQLEGLAYAAADYVHATRETQAGRPYRDSDDLALLRIEVRYLMANNLLLAGDRVRLGQIRADGLDADIARLCGVPDEA